MKQSLFYKLLAFILLALNAVTLFVLLRKPGAEDRRTSETIHGIIVDRLSLSKDQEIVFDSLQQANRQDMDRLQEEDRKLHDEYFSLLKADKVDMALRDSLARKMDSANDVREKIVFDHFRAIRGMLVPGQISRYNDFIVELTRLMHRQGGPPGRPGEQGMPPPPGGPPPRN